MFILSSSLGLNSIYAIIIMEMFYIDKILIRRPDWITCGFSNRISD